MAKEAKHIPWHHQRNGALIVATLSIVLAYVVASLAIDSGNILEYLIVVALVILTVNRLAHVVLLSLNKIKGEK